MKYLFLILTTILTLASCNNNTDNEAPVMEILSISPSLQTDSVCGTLEENNVIRINTGDSLKFQLKLTDNQGLSQIKVDIHENFDCHGHKSVSPWIVLDIVDLSGIETVYGVNIPVPTNATAGTYHFQIRVLDLSGNETGGTQAYSILLSNRDDVIPPSLTVNTPNSPISLNRGDNLNFTGSVTDNMQLNGGRIELVYFTPSDNRQLVSTVNFDNNSGTSYNYNFNYTIPATLTVGTYKFQLRAFDAVGNSSFSNYIEVNLN